MFAVSCEDWCRATLLARTSISSDQKRGGAHEIYSLKVSSRTHGPGPIVTGHGSSRLMMSDKKQGGEEKDKETGAL